MIESVSQTSDLSDLDLHPDSTKAALHLTVFPTAALYPLTGELRPASRHCSPIALRSAVNGEKRLNGGFSSRRRPVLGKMFSGEEDGEVGGSPRGGRKRPLPGRLSPIHSLDRLANSPSDPRLGCHRLRTIRSKGGLLAGTPRETTSGEVLSVTSPYSKKPVLFHRLAIEFNSAAKIREVRKGQPRLRMLLYK